MKDTEASIAQTYVERIVYNAKGQRILLALGNGVMTRYRYNSTTYRLERVKTEKYDNSSNPLIYQPNGGNQLNMSYEYDLAGNIVKTIDETSNAGIPNTLDGLNKLTRQFTYDALYRLLSANGRETDRRGIKPWEDTFRSSDPNAASSYSEIYQYDKLGNMQSLQHTSTNGFTREFAYAANTNKLETITIGSEIYTFHHDVNGNIISDDGGNSRHYEYNYGEKIRVFKRQVGISEPSTYVHYLYDSGGNRVKKLVRKQGGGYDSTVYIDGVFEYKKTSGYTSLGIPNLKIGEWVIGGSETGDQSTLHIMAGQSRIATRRTGEALGDTTPEIKYNIEDHLNSSSYLLDTNGSLINREEYTPFGETAFGSYGKKKYRYNGKEKDEESGLYNYGMRYYSPWTCRFMSVDPLAPKYANLTPYQYAGNRPINFVDIDGLESPGNNPTPQGGGGSTQQPAAGPLNVPPTSAPDDKQSNNTVSITDFVSAERVKQFQESVKRTNEAMKPAPEPTQDEVLEHFGNKSSGLDRNTTTGKLPTKSPVNAGTRISAELKTAESISVELRDAMNDYAEGLKPAKYSGIPIVGPLNQGLKDIAQGRYVEGAVNLTVGVAETYVAVQTLGGLGPLMASGEVVATEIAATEVVASNAAKTGSSWIYGAFKSEAKWAGQLSKRGWTAEQITEAVTKGKSFDAVNMVNKANSATRYVHPTTGQSVVIDNVTKELLHVGGPGFKY